MYSKLFAWIVHRINAASVGDVDVMGGDGDGEEGGGGGKTTAAVVGLLDIFGFEIFEHNSFEQFCINYANEKLHKHYLDVVFMNELSVYRQEGVHIDAHSTMPTFSGVPALLDRKPTGLLWMLSEEMRIPKGTSTTWFHKIKKTYGTHGATPNSVVEFDPIDACPTFIVRHFAGSVIYDHSDFMNKNRDSMEPTLVGLMRTSTFPFLRDLFAEKRKEKHTTVADLFPCIKGRSGRSGRNGRNGRNGRANKKVGRAIALQFRAQLRDLMHRIETANVQFVRCIKPNKCSQNKFDGRHVLQQLKYSGIGELLEFRKQGYPFRYSYNDFINKYSYLIRRQKGGYEHDEHNEHNEQDKCLEILQLVPQGRYTCGKTMIFLGNSIHLALRVLHSTLRIDSAVLLQSRIRTWLVECRHRRKQQAMAALPNILSHCNRTALKRFVQEHKHYLETNSGGGHGGGGGGGGGGGHGGGNLWRCIQRAKTLDEQIARVEEGANEVRRVLQRMQDPSLRITPGVLEHALLYIQTKSTDVAVDVDAWLSEDMKETVKIGMNYILRVQTLNALRAALRSALVNGETMEAEMSLSILENMTDHKSFWKEVVDARSTLVDIEREQSIAVPLLLHAMHGGHAGGASEVGEPEEPGEVESETKEEGGHWSGRGRGSSRSRGRGSSAPRLSNVTFAVSEGSDEAHALDVAIIQATRVGIVTAMGKNCAEAARLLRELIKETDNDGTAPTNWNAVTTLLAQATTVRAVAPELFERFANMLDHSSTMDELTNALSTGSAQLLSTTQKVSKHDQFDFSCIRVEPLKTLVRQSISMGVGSTNGMLLASSQLILRIREAQVRHEWVDINQTLKDADALEQVHPSVLAELKIAKDAHASWKKHETEANANVNQSFVVTVSTPNGATQQVTVNVNGAAQQIVMKKVEKERKQKANRRHSVLPTPGVETQETQWAQWAQETQETQADKMPPHSAGVSIINGIHVSTKDIHTIVVGAANVR